MVPQLLLDQIRKLRPEVSRGSEADQANFRGDRFLPGYSDGSVELQHLHRYSFALPFVIGKDVVDIACGEGYGCDLMGHVATHVTGVDIDEHVVDMARERYPRSNVEFKIGSATAIPLSSGSADVIVSFETLEHLSDQDAFWLEIIRILRENGLLIISSPNREIYNSQRPDHNLFHTRELTREELTVEISRRFKQYALYSQSIVFGSAIVPTSSHSSPPTVISVDPNTAVLQWKVGNEVEYPISIAIASDQLPFLPEESLYTGHYPPNAMASLVGGIAERDQIARELRNRVELKEHVAGDSELRRQRDEALLQVQRINQTLDEQKRTIHALQGLLTECTRRLTTSGDRVLELANSTERKG